MCPGLLQSRFRKAAPLQATRSNLTRSDRREMKGNWVYLDLRSMHLCQERTRFPLSFISNVWLSCGFIRRFPAILWLLVAFPPYYGCQWFLQLFSRRFLASCGHWSPCSKHTLSLEFSRGLRVSWFFFSLIRFRFLQLSSTTCRFPCPAFSLERFSHRVWLFPTSQFWYYLLLKQNWHFFYLSIRSLK